MQVLDGLTAVLADVGDDAVALVKTFGRGNLGNGGKDGGDERRGLGRDGVGRGDVRFGNDENGGGGLRRDVTEGVDGLVLVHLGGRNIARKNFAE